MPPGARGPGAASGLCPSSAGRGAGRIVSALGIKHKHELGGEHSFVGMLLFVWLFFLPCLQK